jgi:hypothetical protein
MTSVLRIFNKGRSDKIDYIDSILNDERPSNEEINKQFDVLLVCFHKHFLLAFFHYITPKACTN